MSNVKVTVYDGSYHDVDSSEMAFKIAASMAVKQAAHKAKPVLLEPVMSVEVVVPEEYMGDVIGDLNSRRGRIEGMELRGTSQIIKSMVPLVGNVRLCHRRALAHSGARQFHDAFRPVRGSAGSNRRGNHHPGAG